MLFSHADPDIRIDDVGPLHRFDGVLGVTKVHRQTILLQKGRDFRPGRKALRPGKLSYVSLESMLSEHGVISQIPLSRLTVMTTGAGGVHKTPFGTIEFTHTKRSVPDILERTVFIKGRPLRIAKKRAAVTDLLRVGRNTDMIDYEELDEVA